MKFKKGENFLEFMYKRAHSMMQKEKNFGRGEEKVYRENA